MKDVIITDIYIMINDFVNITNSFLPFSNDFHSAFLLL